MRPNSLFVWLLCLAAAGAAQAQIRNPFGGKKTDEQKKEEAQKKEQKNENRYAKLKEYSVDKYANDPDFKEEVEQKFGDLLRDHSDRAYSNNVERASYMRTVHEDNWREHYKLYDNLRVQDHVNQIGQKLVPATSERLFAFKVTPSPIPFAETLATGTIYISSGLISLLDNEAQLSFVLAHEMAHVELEHWKERVMMEVGQDYYAAEQSKKIARLALLGTLVGAGIGAGVDGGRGAIIGAGTGALAGAITGALLNRPLLVDWDRVQEDKADEMAFKQVLAVNYDVREVPKLYTTIENSARRDTRVALGFMGDRRRVGERKEKAADLITNAYKADIDAKLKGGQFIGDSPEHRNLMAELKRDNGIMAYYHDMFDMARQNLKEAVTIRDNDPAAHYFYGKVLELIGRTPEERKEELTAFANAVKFDYRHQNYGADLHYGLALMDQNQQDNKAVSSAFDKYVTDFAYWQVENRQLAYFPPNLDSIYEYMRLYGDTGWRPKPPDLTTIPNYIQAFGTFVGPPPEAPAAPAVRTAAPAAPPAVDPAAMAKRVQGAIADPKGAVKGAARDVVLPAVTAPPVKR